MALYRFGLDARLLSAEVDIELADDAEAIAMADRDGDDLALRALEEGALVEADVDILQRFNEETKRWEDVEEF